MERDDGVVVLGEDVGKAGGVFRATEGLLEQFGEARVIDTPLSECGIVGTAIGMALYGLKPVAEIQFADFIYPAFDQIVSELAKMRYRSGGEYTCPMVDPHARRAAASAAATTTRSRPRRTSSTRRASTSTRRRRPRDAKGLLIASIRGQRPGDLLRAEAHLPHREGRGLRTTPTSSCSPARRASSARARTSSLISWGAGPHVPRGGGRRRPKQGIEAASPRPPHARAARRRARSSTRRAAAGRVVIVSEAPRTCGFGAEISAHHRGGRGRQPRGADRARDRLRHAVPVHARAVYMPRRSGSWRRSSKFWIIDRGPGNETMTFEFKLPDIGEGVTEGEITRWLVKEGDVVKEDQPMVEVMTDKATVEITSPKSGRIQKILFPEGSVAPVHEVIVVIDEDGERRRAAPPPRASAARARRATRRARGPPLAARSAAAPARRRRRAAPRPQPRARAGSRRGADPSRTPSTVPADARRPDARGTLTPYARASLPAAAARPGADGRRLTATARGPRPRDSGHAPPRARARRRSRAASPAAARAAASSRPTCRPPPSRRRAAAPAPRPRAGTAAAAPSSAPRPASRAGRLPSPAASGGDERIPYRGLRRAIAEQMVQLASPRRTSRSSTSSTSPRSTRSASTRRPTPTRPGVKLTYLPFVMKALCAAIRKFPTINALARRREERVRRQARRPHRLRARHRARPHGAGREERRAPRAALDRVRDQPPVRAGRAGKASREDLTGSHVHDHERRLDRRHVRDARSSTTPRSRSSASTRSATSRSCATARS